MQICSPRNNPSQRHGGVLPGFEWSADLDASLRRGDALEEWVGKKVLEGERSLDCAGGKVQEIMVLESEVRALESLGENVL